MIVCRCGKVAIAEMGGLWVCATCAMRKIYKHFPILEYYHPLAKQKN
jgi:hypothetical protein